MKKISKSDYFEISKFFEKTCDDCKWENEAFEEEPGDGGAPCKKCIRWDGER